MAITFVGVGTNVEVIATTHTLVEPAGVLPGDLLVACISSRIASITAVTLPAGWILAHRSGTNNVLAGDVSGYSSTTMAYIVRGASAPSFTFTHPIAPSVAIGRVVAYRGIDAGAPHISTEDNNPITGTNVTACSWTGMTTSQDNDLMVAMCSGGRAATFNNFTATDPGTGAGTVDDTSSPPTAGTWYRRSGTTTLTGADTSLAIFDAIKATAGATGNITATASLASGHKLVIAAFKATPWNWVSHTTIAETASASFALSEPAGAAEGDLVVANIASRIASTTPMTLPAGWTLVGEVLNNNILATSSAAPSATMAYIIRGASPPSYTFTFPTAPSVALGRVSAYRNADTSSLDVAQTGQTAINITAVSLTGLTTAAPNDLIVALMAGGQEANFGPFAATDPGVASGASDAVSDPVVGVWTRRATNLTTTGVDTALGVFDAVKATAGATGNFTCTASVAAVQGLIAGAFKIVVAPTGTTYDEDQDETAAAAEEVAVSQFERSGLIAETATSAETVAGLLDATRVVAETAAAADTLGGLLVTEKAIAETAAAAETLTGGLAFVDTVAEAAAAADTVGKLVSVAGAVAETVAAAETVTGQFDTTKAIAESAAAAETVGGLLSFTRAIAETTSAADTLTGGLAFSLTLAETASAADTISKAVSFTSVIAETASAADTTGGLLVRSAAIVETASAAETTVGLLTFTAAIAETESAAETITYSVESVGGTTYNDAQLETLAAAEIVAGQMMAAGALAETASAAETITRAVSFTGTVAESAAGADTVGKLLTVLGAVAETAAAAETTAASLIPASVVYNLSVAESASAAETVAATRVTTGAIAETAAATETITRAVAYTLAVVETASAVDTVGRLVGHDGAIAETASATDTITTTLDATRGVVEIAAAVDSITYTWIVPWRRDPSAWQAWATDTPPAATGWTRAAPPSATWQALPQSSVRVTMEATGGDRIRITEAGAIRIVEGVAVRQWTRDPHLANTWTKE